MVPVPHSPDFTECQSENRRPMRPSIPKYDLFIFFADLSNRVASMPTTFIRIFLLFCLQRLRRHQNSSDRAKFASENKPPRGVTLLAETSQVKRNECKKKLSADFESVRLVNLCAEEKNRLVERNLFSTRLFARCAAHAMKRRRSFLLMQSKKYSCIH